MTECVIQACFTASANIASHTHNLRVNCVMRVDRNSTVGIATRYVLDGPLIESPWEGGTRSYAPVHTSPGAHPASYTTGTGSFPGVKRLGRDVDQSRTEVKEGAEI